MQSSRPPSLNDSAIAVEDDFFHLLTQIPGLWGCKDLRHRYICASKKLTQLLGFANQRDINGHTDADLPCGARECASAYELQDKIVIQKRVELKILDIVRFANDEWRVQITTKFPLFNKDGTIIGISFHVIDTTTLGTFELSQLLHEKYLLQEPAEQLRPADSVKSKTAEKMTPKEAEVLFFLLRGKSAKMIARILNSSIRTIEHHINSLKYKFGISNKYELINVAINHGYLNFLPPSLLGSQRSIILSEFDHANS